MADKDFDAHLDRRIKAFRGDLTKLERAIGIYFIGKKFGYKTPRAERSSVRLRSSL